MHSIINVWGYTEILHNLRFVSAVFCQVKHSFHLIVTFMGLTWPFNFSTVILKGDEERERQMSKQN